MVYLGELDCAKRLLDLSPRGGKSLVLGFGLDSAVVVDEDRERVLALSSERYPFSGSSPDLESWLARNGKLPSWYEALGHDAALLGKAVLEALPEVEATRSAEVNAHRDRVRVELLKRPPVSLWTAPEADFDETLALKRQLRVVLPKELSAPERAAKGGTSTP